MTYNDIIEKFKTDRPNDKLIYVVKYGAHLYGTEHDESDTDYKGIYIPNKNSMILKQDKNYWKCDFKTGDRGTKNNKDDIDFELYSIHHFFNLLKKGETNALGILFSMFRFDTIKYEDKKYTNELRLNYKDLITNELSSYLGYCTSQASKYGLKGSRYKELADFIDYLDNSFTEKDKSLKLEEFFDVLKSQIQDKQYKYIEFKMADAPRGQKIEQWEYLSVLNKLQSGTVTFEKMYNMCIKLRDSYGERTKKSLDGDSWKSLSHAYRIITEANEYIEHQWITYPRPNAKKLKMIKFGNACTELIMKELEDLLEVTKKLSEDVELKEQNQEVIERLLLEWIQ